MRALLITAALMMAACAETPAPPPVEPAPSAALQLTGTRWVLADLEAPGTHAPTLEFGDSERASGFAGCNQWFAQVSRANGGLQFGSVGMTRRACPEPAMGIERAFGATLAATRNAQRDGEDLLLFGGEAEQLARFTPAR